MLRTDHVVNHAGKRVLQSSKNGFFALGFAQCKVYQLPEVCNRHINNWVAEGNEFVNMTVAYIQQFEKLIVQRFNIKYSPYDRVNADSDMRKLCPAFSS